MSDRYLIEVEPMVFAIWDAIIQSKLYSLRAGDAYMRQKVISAIDNGLSPNRRQVII